MADSPMLPSPDFLLNPDRVRSLIEAAKRPVVQAVAKAQETDDDLAEGEGPCAEQDYAPRGTEVGHAFGVSYARAMDRLLEELFVSALAASGVSTKGIALAGVGSFGRGAMAYGADLDLRLLTSDLDTGQRVAEALLYPLWDAGMAMGHQVVTIDDVIRTARDDLPTLTSVLDWRHVAGDVALSVALTAQGRQSLFDSSKLSGVMDQLEGAVRGRHARFGGSVYLLEPDVKNGLGALRDLDMAGWAARARWGTTDIRELVRVGVLVGRQADAVLRAREHLWRIRNLLHHAAGRRHDRLSYERQEIVAPLLGYGTELPDSVEEMMSHYYRAARTISRFRQLLTVRARPVLRPRKRSEQSLGGGVVRFDGRVTLRDSDALVQDPGLAFELMHKSVQYRSPLGRSIRNTLVGLCGDAAWTEALRRCPRAARYFVDLVCSRDGLSWDGRTLLGELHDIGLLLAMVPEFAPVVGRVHHDTYHVYTVDVHSVRAVDRLVEIIRAEVMLDEEESERWVGSLACSLGTELPRPKVLFFATLLHDVGKAIGRRDHSERGAEMAAVILGRLAAASAGDGETPLFFVEDINDVCRLIEHHLTMYLTATRRDLDDTATIAEFAKVVRDRDGLRNLYLLTVSDLSTTSPKSMTSWKARMLDELYLATDEFIRGGGRSDEGLLARRKQDVGHVIAEGLEDEEREQTIAFAARFVEAMPQRYTLAHGADAIASHAQLVMDHVQSNSEVSVQLVPSRHDDVSALCVVASDRMGLLQSIAAVLIANRLSVHGAQIYSCDRMLLGDARQAGALAVDLFWVRCTAGGARGVPRAVEGFTKELRALVSGQRELDDVVARHPSMQVSRGKQPPIKSRVVVDNRTSPRYTLVEVITQDRPGLLFSLAQAIYEQDMAIAVAKISTEGTRAVDVFYIHEQNGEKVMDELRLGILKDTLKSMIVDLKAS